MIVDEGRLLVVRRGRGPASGRWSVPGGRVEPGEPLARAVEREVLEETNLTVACGAFIGWVEHLGPEHHFVILDFWAGVIGSAAGRAGDDAAELAWVPLARVGHMDLVDGLADFLVGHGVIPQT